MTDSARDDSSDAPAPRQSPGLGARLGRAPLAFIQYLNQEADGCGLSALRVGLGIILCTSALRFLFKGWVEEIYVAPRFHFTYFGFEWVKPWPEPWMSLHVGALALFGACIALGLFTRWAAACYFLLFSYAELIEKAAYLNHYYLVSILVLFLVFVPADVHFSLGARLRGGRIGSGAAELGRLGRVTNGHYALFRAQLAIVYLYAGLAKLNSDWLFRAEPIHTWLRAYSELPLLGPWLNEPFIAFAVSYFGALFDLTIPFAISWPRSRPYAIGLALVFHLSISFLFPVGVFSYVMLIGLTSFLPPAWPRLVYEYFRGPASRVERRRAAVKSRPQNLLWIGLACFHLGIQVLIPLRFLLYPGHVNWTEQGFRFSWRVMLLEKAGHVEFHVLRPRTGEEFLVFPRDELTAIQRKQMAVEADMIHEYALHLANLYRREPGEVIEVRADSFVAWNGRPSQRFIDPTTDLAAIPRSLHALPFILPAPP